MRPSSCFVSSFKSTTSTAQLCMGPFLKQATLLTTYSWPESGIWGNIDVASKWKSELCHKCNWAKPYYLDFHLHSWWLIHVSSGRWQGLLERWKHDVRTSKSWSWSRISLPTCNPRWWYQTQVFLPQTMVNSQTLKKLGLPILSSHLWTLNWKRWNRWNYLFHFSKQMLYCIEE